WSISGRRLLPVGQVDNLRGGWLPPPVCHCNRTSGPIDNRPQVSNLPHKASARRATFIAPTRWSISGRRLLPVGQVDNLRGGWLPPLVCHCNRTSGPIDNRPQVSNLPRIAANRKGWRFSQARSCAPKGGRRIANPPQVSNLPHRNSSRPAKKRMDSSTRSQPGVLPSLRPRDGPFQAGEKIQFRRGESEHFLISAVERVPQVAVSGHAAAEGVIQVDAGVGESGIPEQSVARAKVRLLVECAASEIAGEIGGEPSTGKAGDHIPRMLGTARQLLSYGKRQRRLIARAIERKDTRFEQRVGAGDEHPTGRPQARGELRALGLRVGEVGGCIVTQGSQRARRGDD